MLPSNTDSNAIAATTSTASKKKKRRKKKSLPYYQTKDYYEIEIFTRLFTDIFNFENFDLTGASESLKNFHEKQPNDEEIENHYKKLSTEEKLDELESLCQTLENKNNAELKNEHAFFVKLLIIIIKIKHKKLDPSSPEIRENFTQALGHLTTLDDDTLEFYHLEIHFNFFMLFNLSNLNNEKYKESLIKLADNIISRWYEQEIDECNNNIEEYKNILLPELEESGNITKKLTYYLKDLELLLDRAENLHEKKEQKCKEVLVNLELPEVPLYSKEYEQFISEKLSQEIIELITKVESLCAVNKNLTELSQHEAKNLETYFNELYLLFLTKSTIEEKLKTYLENETEEKAPANYNTIKQILFQKDVKAQISAFMLLSAPSKVGLFLTCDWILNNPTPKNENNNLRFLTKWLAIFYLLRIGVSNISTDKVSELFSGALNAPISLNENNDIDIKNYIVFLKLLEETDLLPGGLLNEKQIQTARQLHLCYTYKNAIRHITEILEESKKIDFFIATTTNEGKLRSLPLSEKIKKSEECQEALKSIVSRIKQAVEETPQLYAENIHHLMQMTATSGENIDEKTLQSIFRSSEEHAKLEAFSQPSLDDLNRNIVSFSVALTLAKERLAETKRLEKARIKISELSIEELTAEIESPTTGTKKKSKKKKKSKTPKETTDITLVETTKISTYYTDVDASPLKAAIQNLGEKSTADKSILICPVYLNNQIPLLLCIQIKSQAKKRYMEASCFSIEKLETTDVYSSIFSKKGHRRISYYLQRALILPRTKLLLKDASANETCIEQTKGFLSRVQGAEAQDSHIILALCRIQYYLEQGNKAEAKKTLKKAKRKIKNIDKSKQALYLKKAEKLEKLLSLEPVSSQGVTEVNGIKPCLS